VWHGAASQHERAGRGTPPGLASHLTLPCPGQVRGCGAGPAAGAPGRGGAADVAPRARLAARKPAVRPCPRGCRLATPAQSLVGDQTLRSVYVVGARKRAHAALPRVARPCPAQGAQPCAKSIDRGLSTGRCARRRPLAPASLPTLDPCQAMHHTPVRSIGRAPGSRQVMVSVRHGVQSRHPLQ